MISPSLSGGKRIPSVVDDPHLCAFHGQADGADLFYTFQGIGRIVRPSLCQAPAFDNLEAEGFLETVKGLEG